MRFGTYNLLNMYASDSREQTARYERVHTVIQSLDVDVLAVQELIADGDDKAVLAGRRLSQLAEATGLRCEHTPGKPAVAVGNHRFHAALLWRDGITPAGGWGSYAGVNVWHSLALLHLDVGATRPIKVGSFHATPFGKNRRADEAERVLAAMTRPAGGPPGIIGGDWNAISADRVFEPGWVDEDGGQLDRWRHYDDDPYATSDWHPDFVYQCEIVDDEYDGMSWAADRRPGAILAHGGLRDVAAELRAPWQTTVGYWEDDPYGQRRIDIIRTTAEVVPALRGYEVADTPMARIASDHLPVTCVLDPAAIVDKATP